MLSHLRAQLIFTLGLLPLGLTDTRLTIPQAAILGRQIRKLIDRVKTDLATLQSENPGKPVPVDLVTTSGSGLDPHITPAGAEFQVPRVAKARGISEDELLKLAQAHTERRQFGFLGEPRVNVLELNLALDEKFPAKSSLAK